MNEKKTDQEIEAIELALITLSNIISRYLPEKKIDQLLIQVADTYNDPSGANTTTSDLLIRMASSAAKGRGASN